MTETRDRILEHVQAHPGVHFNRLVRSLDLAPGQVQYHLRRLSSRDSVVSRRLYGRTHYYPPGYGPWEQQALALLRRETAGDVVAFLLANGASRPATVADELDIARSTLEWHLGRLVDGGVVAKRRDGHDHVTLVLERPDDTIRLLRDADPSLGDRFVDRFARLVDRLLTE